MKSTIIALVTMIAIPLTALAVATSIQSQFHSDWDAALTRQFGQAATSIKQEFSLSSVCKDPELSNRLGQACFTYNAMTLMSRAALFTTVLGMLLFGGIAIAGQLCRKQRVLLLRIFKPGLYVTIAALAMLIILEGALATASIYFGESVFTGYVHPKLIALVGIGAVIGVVGMLRGVASVIKPAKTAILSKRVSSVKEPLLYEFVHNLARKIGAKAPLHIIAGLSPNFFVTEAKVRCLDGELTGRTMYISLPLCRIVTRGEFTAVLAHELAHYKGLDTEFSQKFYPVYRGTSEALVGLAQHLQGIKSIALWPAFGVLSYFFKSFSVAETEISRDRELVADRVASEYTDRRDLARALIKVHAFAGQWQTLRAVMRDALAQNQVITNASLLFGHMINTQSDRDALNDLDEERIAHPTNTHPPLSVRLESLDVTIPELADAVLSSTAPQGAAIELLTNHDELEKELSSAEHELLIASGEVVPGSAIRTEGACTKECPSCSMFNPEAAKRCMCGFIFEDVANS